MELLLRKARATAAGQSADSQRFPESSRRDGYGYPGCDSDSWKLPNYNCRKFAATVAAAANGCNQDSSL